MAGLIRTVKGARNWDVRYSQPKTTVCKDGTSFTHSVNRYTIVIAETAAIAIELIQAEFPDAAIHQVNCKGSWEDTRIFLQAEMVAV